MKKLLAIAVVVASLAACNDAASDKTETTDTSTVITQDTSMVVKETTVTTDTLNRADVVADSTDKADTTKK